MKNDKIKRYFEMVSLNLLHSGLAYQRQINANFVQEKVNNFDEKEVEAPCVSLRDGKYNVVDGQHTIAIVTAKGWTKIRCEIRTGLTEEEENEWFHIKNTKKRPQSKSAILNSRYFSKTDDTLNDLVAYLSTVGYKLKTSDVSNTVGVINATDTIENIFKSMGKSQFLRYINIHCNTWNGNRKSLSANFLKGFAKFFDTYSSQIKDDRFIKVFTGTSKKRAKTIEELSIEADSDVYTKDVALKYAKVLVKYYNVGLSKDNQLKMSKLED